MTDAEQFDGPEVPFTLTLKGGTGFDSPWIVIRAASADDAVALLGEAKLAELFEKTAEFAGDFQGAYSGGAEKPKASAGGSSRRSAPARGGASRPAPKAAADDELHPEGLVCGECEGDVIYKEINSRGKKYELWVCRNQRTKGDGHHSEFIN